MVPTVQFFAKLKKLAVTLESETFKLQHDFENRNNNDDDYDDSETTARAMKAYHHLNCDVGNLKGQIQGQVAQLKAQENDVGSFIKASRVMQQRVTKDIQVLKGHWEKYGYQAPGNTQRPSHANGQQSEAAGEESEGNEAVEEGESQEEAGGSPSSSPQRAKPPASSDVTHTPQLSDFGLSEVQLKKTLAAAEWSMKVPELSLPPPLLYTPASPPMLFTPKCALRMDDEDLQTPQLSDFGITEHTMCMNNDFTMDLFKKNVEKPQRPSEDLPTPPMNTLMERSDTQAQNLRSPEPPDFRTPGLKIEKTNGDFPQYTLPESPCGLGHLPNTPEVPAFQTPYVNRLLSTKKSAWQPGNSDEDSRLFELPSPSNGATGSKRPWEYDVPEISIMGVEDREMPEMPNLESTLGSSLQNKSAKMPRNTLECKKERTDNSLDLDGPTQNFTLGTPQLRMDYDDPSTPEMPDLSSVTQDICKVVSQVQLNSPTVAVVHPRVRTNIYKNRAVSLSAVSESEFQSLPKYLRQITLHNLNQVVQNINTFTAESEGEHTEFQMEELRRICMVGIKTPIFILCLTELKRLEHIEGAGNTSVYKLCAQH
ncbi:hypothetical protein PBY51_022208 [Eleginops maclovinus]|uniref:Spindle and kinetochore-associated protein 3 n=1 Tax=Eleginops maclovinus TaxID=56733 RepID=A0AAN7XI96_ELEMC|nr:hypothetical protein PBY51_022208 [Eleginops maclovinus]